MRLVLCDNNRILCEVLAAKLQACGHQVLAIATSATEGVAAVAEHRPDACLLELRFPDESGLDAAQVMRRSHPETKIVVLSRVTDSVTVSEAKKIGVAGYLCKDREPETVTGALEVIGAGGLVFGSTSSRQPGWRTMPSPREDILWNLTPRERQVLHRIVAGQSTEQMSREMNVATSTLRSHIRGVLNKLGAHSRVQAAAIASQYLR
jgi:two-component system, NarL family, nitrate/nitrite response regulator NarL